MKYPAVERGGAGRRRGAAAAACSAGDCAPRPAAARRQRNRAQDHDREKRSVSWHHLLSDREVDLLHARHVGRQRLAVAELRVAIRALGVEQIEQRAGAALVDVAS